MIYTFTKVVNPSKLAKEVAQSNFSHISTEGTVVHIHYVSETDAAALTAIVNAHIPVSASDTVKAAIANAVVFGQGLILEYATSNVISAFTLEQIKDIMTRTAAVQQALNTGSLYVAMDALDNLETDETLITPTQALEFKNKIETYLGLPLSEPP
jgi:hypothetical protein